MPLINCPACGNQVSSDAPSCPKCGHPFTLSADLKAKDKSDGNAIFYCCLMPFVVFILLAAYFFLTAKH